MTAEENVARVRRGIEAFSRGEIERAVAGLHPDVRWEISPEMFPDAATYQGHEGVHAFWRQWFETFEGFRLEVEECFAVGDSHVIALTRAVGTGAGSGATVDSPRFAQLFELRDGRTVRVRLLPSRDAAVRAAEAGM